jgi:hypothetical protein
LARRLAATVALYGWEGGLAMNEELRQSLEAFVEQTRKNFDASSRLTAEDTFVRK